jgi:hypothetical protein
MSTDSTAPTVTELSLVERISKIEESLKDLKRAARHELRNRRRRRGVRKDGAAAGGEKGAKGETPAQLVAWHTEVRKVWDEMRKSDAKTPYKRAVAEASARRKGAVPTGPAVAVVPAAKAVKAVKAAAPVAVAAPAPSAAKANAVKATKA